MDKSQIEQLTQWYRQYGPELLLFARQLTTDQGAEDLVQEAFVQLLRQSSLPENVRAWLYRVVRNTAKSMFRRLRHRTLKQHMVRYPETDWFDSRPDDRMDAQYAQDLLEAVLIYANDHGDALPLTLENLREVEVTEKSMICPAVKTQGSYVYRGKGISVSYSPDLIVLYDKRENHHGTTHRNVLFLDSHVEWVAEERFQELIRKDNAYRRKKGLPELPAQ